MAVMNTLRDKMGKIVLFTIALAMIAFIVGDIFGNNSFLFGRDDKIGSIAGEEISQSAYDEAINEMKNNFLTNAGRQPSERDMVSIRQQAWDLLIAKIAFGKEIETLGITVSDDELYDMLTGKNVNPSIKQSFVNPQTGQFDRSLVVNHLQAIERGEMPPQAKIQWILFEQTLKPGRERLKYDNLMLASAYATQAEAQQEYSYQSDVAEVKVLYVPYYSVTDSIDITESAIETYYSEHKHEYEVEASKDVKFVTFDILPSAADSAAVMEEIEEIKAEFKTIQDDSLYARSESDGSQFYQTYVKGELPVILRSNIDILSKGDVIGPYSEGNGYRLYKISDIQEDTVFSTKARHILIKPTDDSDEAKATARKDAQDILNKIKAGEDFVTLARENGQDGTASRGGDLGWFTQGKKMVKEFDDAIFAQNSKGLINQLVETNFGFHIVELTEDPTNIVYKIAMVDRELIYSTATQDMILRQVDAFSSKSKDLTSFQENADNAGYTVLEARGLKVADRRVGQAGEARSVVRWAFNKETSIGDVSEVFDLDNGFIVAVVTAEQDKGTASLTSIRSQIEDKLKQQLQGERIIKKLNELGAQPLDALASAYGSDASVHNNGDLKFNAPSIPGVGYSPLTLGIAFGLEPGAKSKATPVENGVVIVELQNLTAAPEVADYTSYKTQLEQNYRNKSSYNINQAIREFADIEDKRYKFQ